MLLELTDLGLKRVIVFSHHAPTINLVQSMKQRIDHRLAAGRVVEQVILQIRIATHDPDIAEHFVQHARGTTGLAQAAQLGDQVPCSVAQQANHDLAIRE